MSSIDYTIDEHVAIVTMNRGENKFNFDFFDEINGVLDEIENSTDATVLVVKSSHEKIWSNGIDLEWLINVINNQPEETKEFPYKLTGLFKRLLYYPLITVAAINGHAFAGGAIMACSFDFRFMRSDRGFFCLPEVDLKIPLTPSMIAVVKKAVPEYKFNEMQYLGIRMTGEECEKHNIVMKACHNDDLMDEVMKFTKSHNKDKKIIGTMKELTYKHMLQAFEEGDREWFNSGRTGLG